MIKKLQTGSGNIEILMENIEKKLMKSQDWLITLGLLIGATGISYLFYIMSQTTTNIAIVYILFVVLTSRLTTGYRWGIFASGAGVVAVNYFFTEPFMVIDFAKNGYPITFCGMLIISLITSALTTHLKRMMKSAENREQILRRLNEINSKLLAADNMKQLEKISVKYIADFIESATGIWLQTPENNFMIQDFLLKEMAFFSEEEREKREEAFEGKIAESENCSYYPLISHNKVWGVLGIQYLERMEREEKEEKERFLKLVCSQIAIALERQYLADEHQSLEAQAEKEKMRSNLLRAISHDLRTPLTAIIGASQTCLAKENIEIEEEKKMLKYIYEDSNWLLNMVENLLSVTRIRENGARVIKTIEPIEEVVLDAILRLKKRYSELNVEVKLPEEILMVPMDPVLIEQVVINLIENAVKHAESKKPIELKIKSDKHIIQVCIRDFGKGIGKKELKNIFDGYCTTENSESDAKKGMGIGLSICKTIICAHGGSIEAYNHEDGAEFLFSLPIEESLS